MEKPTVEQIKKHFENAKEVMCLHGESVKKIGVIYDSFYDSGLWGKTPFGDEIWMYSNLYGYAEIVSFKNTEESENINEINVIFDEVKGVDKEALFNQVVSDTLEQIKETLLIKGKEYRRNNNPFHNFEEGARIKGITREKVLDGMLLKHEISINDMTNDLDNNILPSEEIVNEKFNDNIIYLILKKASILDRIKNNLKQ